MSFKTRILVAASAAVLSLTALPAFAEGIEVHDAYARASSMMSSSGAAFMVIHNHDGPDDRLVDVRSDVADKVELHTHREDDNGVMRMIHVEEGFALPRDGEIVLKRGGHHLMFFGIKEPFEHGDIIPLTLVFDKAGEVQVEVPVDLERTPMHGQMEHKQGD